MPRKLAAAAAGAIVVGSAFCYGIASDHYDLFPAVQLQHLWRGVRDGGRRSRLAELQQGRQLYRVHCLSCHGVDGTGGRAPSFRDGALEKIGGPNRIMNIIRNGVPGTEMPNFRVALGPKERASIVTYLESLDSEPGRTVAPADSAGGFAVFFGAGGCAACHRVGSRGGRLGPDLSHEGARRGSTYLRQAIVDPNSNISPGFRLVELVDMRGDTIRGFVLDESAFSIQIMDLSERLRSFRKAELRSARLIEESLMPDYSRILSKRQVDELVAYLSSLRDR